jgi:hypothetical protein
MSRGFVVAFVAVSLAAPAARAQAPVPAPPPSTRPKTFQPPPRTRIVAHLDFRLGPGTGECPGASYLHQELARRMGHDPFAPDPEGVPVGTVHVVIERTPPGLKGPGTSPFGLTGTYDFFDTAGVHQWTRRYSEPSTVYEACRGIHQGIAVELAGEFVAFEIEMAKKAAPPPPPPAAAEPAPAPEPPQPAPEPPPPATPPEPPPAPPPKSLRVQGEAGAGATFAYGVVPAPSFGGLAYVGVQVLPFEHGPWFSVAIEGRAEGSLSRPVDARFGPYAVHATVFGGAGAACAHQEILTRGDFTGSIFGCVTGGGGSVRFSYEHQQSSAEATSAGARWGSLGLRIGAEARISPRVALRLHSTASGTFGTARAVTERLPVVLRSAVVAYDTGLSTWISRPD